MNTAINNPLTVAVIGCVQFSGAALERLIANPACEIGLVITRQASAQNSDFKDLSMLAMQHAIPVLYAEGNDQSALCDALTDLQPDVIFCVGWSYLLKSELLAIPRYGVVGYHPAAIPLNRGRHPLIWAMALGLSETASSFFLMDEGADSGKVLSQKPIPIAETDYAADLYRNMTRIALQQLDDLVTNWVTRYQQAKPQIDQGNVWRKRGKNDGRIDWRMSAYNIVNLVRALSQPYPGAHIEYGGEDFSVWRANVETNVLENLEPGKVLSIDDAALIVKCGEAAIRLTQFDAIPNIKVGDYL